jgi:hypothetical protein
MLSVTLVRDVVEVADAEEDCNDFVIRADQTTFAVCLSGPNKGKVRYEGEVTLDRSFSYAKKELVSNKSSYYVTPMFLIKDSEGNEWVFIGIGVRKGSRRDERVAAASPLISSAAPDSTEEILLDQSSYHSRVPYERNIWNPWRDARYEQPINTEVLQQSRHAEIRARMEERARARQDRTSGVRQDEYTWVNPLLEVFGAAGVPVVLSSASQIPERRLRQEDQAREESRRADETIEQALARIQEDEDLTMEDLVMEDVD